MSDASGLYNLSRNLGGAISIALIDTVIFTQTANYSDVITGLLKSAPAQGAALLHIPVADLPDPEDPLGLLGIMDLVGEQALAMAINDAWLMLAGVSLLALPVLLVLGPIRPGPLTERDRYEAP